jgi:hypothetical protein
MDFRTESVVDLAARVRAGTLRASELTEHALERIEALNPTLNAFIALDADSSSPGRAIDADAAGEPVARLPASPSGSGPEAAGAVTWGTPPRRRRAGGGGLHAGRPPAGRRLRDPGQDEHARARLEGRHG